uniref:Uncharacterized protein n=1 Tax=Pseudictyota dubia TaxID=2749911 RepID=A0A7R9W3E9_9STRA|eukprot:CAMPEP_0197439782 /NCGR_PEP_ID=MMETSP1175-20131217/6444_1 /TAXON_ID=1003142 /ORGANISM="Triceratium dubium, Strain CCMP147" /LENGTH=274 /DNA_ID=CAMNT_0042969759 /DNA_START=75 /DNA_END=899 /DNA_ORIENTATION=-
MAPTKSNRRRNEQHSGTNNSSNQQPDQPSKISPIKSARTLGKGGPLSSFSLNGGKKKSNRIFTAGSTTGESHLWVKLPLHDQSAFIKPAQDDIQAKPELMTQFKISDFVPRCDPSDSSKLMSNGRTGNREGPFFEAIYLHENPQNNTATWRGKWGRNIARLLDQYGANFRYPATFEYKGDSTPTENDKAPLARFIVFDQVLRIMALSYNNFTLDDMMNDDTTVKAFFGEDGMDEARAAYARLNGAASSEDSDGTNPNGGNNNFTNMPGFEPLDD